MKIILNLSYKGAALNGWQTQLNFLSIQDLLELLIFKYLKIYFKIKSCCRTDKRVNVLNKIVHFNFYNNKDFNFSCVFFNKFLCDLIFIKWFKYISNDFHSRYSAVSKTYCYIFCLKNNNILYKNLVFNLNEKLNFYFLIKYFKFILGVNNFLYFSSFSRNIRNFIKIIYEINIIKKNKFFFIFLKGNSFLYNMIRNILSNLYFLFKKKNYIFFIDLFYSKKLKYLKPIIPNGLYLIKVDYIKKFNIFYV